MEAISATGANVALWDMDGSLADYEGQLRRDLALLRAPEEPELGNLWDDENRFPHIKLRMKLIKAQPGWWLDLPPIAAGMRVLAKAKEIGFDCHVLTKGPRKHALAWKEKVEWCQKHLGDLPVHVTSDKGLVYGKLLYDDFPDYAEAWLEHRANGLVIMPATDYNAKFSHPQVVRWTGENWDEVVRVLQAAYDRKPGEALRL